jgi:hypothetical protein
MEDAEKMNKILAHLRVIRDKITDLDNTYNTLVEDINTDLLINNKGYRVNELKNIDTSCIDIQEDIRKNIIPDIKDRISN